jgi:thiamine phosphate synthase YjbQ (UPF0047 family)
VLAYYYKNIRISSPNQKEGVLSKYTNDINDFVKEQKILMGHLKNFKQYIGQIVPMKESELRYYKQFAEFLQKYENNQEKTNVALGNH